MLKVGVNRDNNWQTPPESGRKSYLGDYPQTVTDFKFMASRHSNRSTYHQIGFSLALLAIMLIAFGAHAIHPFFHHHEASHSAILPPLTGGISSYQAEHDGLSVTGKTHHHSCPVCDFFKTCHLNILLPSGRFLSAISSYLQVSRLLIELPIYEKQDYPIRGPPLTGSRLSFC